VGGIARKGAVHWYTLLPPPIPQPKVARPDGRVELADPHIYIFVWLGFYGGLPGAVAGVLVAGYWIINRTRPGA
jgi:hypothetical protein